jgi:predicted metal-dependent enzyme (double-stranded beta helix superfamily)
MFSLDNLIADCKDALTGEASAQAAVRDLLTRAVSDPAAVLKELGEPQKGGVVKLHESEELTIINVIWSPHMTIMPHNHEMWANIGVYMGREDNIFWRRMPRRSVRTSFTR